MTVAGQSFSASVIFPSGVTSFTTKAGRVVTPDASGAVTIDYSELPDFIAAGFIPATLSEEMADVGELEAAMIAAQLAIGTLQTNAGVDEAAIVALQAAAPSALMAKAMSGDLVFVVSPATVNRAATGAAWQRTVTISLKTAAGAVHTWFNKAIATGVSIGDDSTAGTASIPSTTLTFVNGVATVVVSGDAQAWLAAETDTLTVAAAVILGVTVPGVTSVQTFT
jgi:hypothetical protein